MIKLIIPDSYKPRLRHWIRQIKDFKAKRKLKFAKPKFHQYHFSHAIYLSQPLKNNDGLKGKLVNMKKAISTFETIIIEPQEVFSFWKYLQEPTIKNGYTEGRTIVEGRLQTSIGGGLCQLGGLLYHIGLNGNLEIIERHNHSLDLYNDNTRYSPLGADAAVAFGFKDLRMKNPYKFPIKFEFNFDNNQIQIKLLSTEKIVAVKPEFEIKINSNHKTVRTFINGNHIETSVYKNGDQIL